MIVIDRFFEIFGHSIHFRFEPKEFRRDCDRVNGLINSEFFSDAQTEIDRLKKKWAPDQEIDNLGIRLRFEKFKTEKRNAHH